MNMIRTRISTFISSLCASLLAVLGFGCSSNTDEPCMYGTPYSSFEIKGKVTTEDGDPVANATVRITQPEFPSGIYAFSKAITGENGVYTAEGSTFQLGEKCKVVCIPEDSSLDADSIIVDLKFIREHEDTWYIGHASAIADFTLKKKKTGE